MFHVPAPNFTQTPNALFDDWLPLLGMAELKVLMVIMRKTFGWHKIRDRISLSQLETITGLERRHVSKAVKGLQEKNLILKIVEGQKGTQNTFYELIVIEDSNNLYQCPKDTPPSVLKTPTKETLTKEIRKENKQKKAAPSAEASSLCDFFLSKIKEKKPNFTERISQKWYQHAERLVKERSLEQLQKVIVFALGDKFWVSVILTPEKLLRNLDALEIRMSQPSNHSQSDTADYNRKLAEMIAKKFPSQVKSSDICLGTSYLEFRFGVNNPGVCLKFTDNGFKEQAINALRKMRLSPEGL